MLSLVKTINKHLETGQVKEEHLERSFNALWDELDSKVTIILESEPVSDEPKRQDADVLNDILDNVLNINKKVSRGTHRDSGRYIEMRHADALLKRLLKMDWDRSDIEEAMEDVAPSRWLGRQLDKIFGEEPEDE